MIIIKNCESLASICGRLLKEVDISGELEELESYLSLKEEKKNYNALFCKDPGHELIDVTKSFTNLLFSSKAINFNEAIIVDRYDLISPYMFQTEGLVNEVFKLSKGRVLVIDRASEVLTFKDNDPFGCEATRIIIQRLIEQDSYVIVLADKKEDLKQLLIDIPQLKDLVKIKFKF